jgi:hypothetical protein
MPVVSPRPIVFVVEKRRKHGLAVMLDVGRFAGAVIALHHDAPVVRKARQDRERRLGIEAVGVIELRHVLGLLREGRHLHVAFDAERAG